ncbi:hypothetical protein P691DRAFT_802710 [Macrolepiota fuliginosa MF-IS2]|uniref:Uncharacterized protein n=1 Tax=Macrolepiota fuliginosa MF-IS2 TaxID=1400762 RepID=A0A9P6BV51_9AGAR|nr:hypothetical protein P691DRAFT_802710 [Macrolepiota fuliginosa MF-IS2]
MLNVLRWIQHARSELRSEFILEEFPPARLDRSRLSIGLCEEKWYKMFTERSTGLETKVDYECIDQVPLVYFDGSRWAAVKRRFMGAEGTLGNLTRLLETNGPKNATVTLFGTSPDNCCGLIRHEISSSEIHYHLFPYSGTQKSTLKRTSMDHILFLVLLFSFLTLWLRSFG